jgi:type IV pilus assembly protein PilM
MQKIIGLDIGSYSIKAVEIINTFKSYEIANFYEKVIPVRDDTDPDVVVPATMEQLFRENALDADRIITAMPGQYISSRILPFNFSDPRKIQAAIFSEVEDVVPFNLDEMIVDHQLLGSADTKTLALVVLTRKIFLKTFLEHLQRINIDPKLVDVDSLSFYNLSPHLNLQPSEVVGLVDIGHEKTSVCLVQGDVLRMFRSINLGGRFLTEFLARDLEIPYLDAQELKHATSFLEYEGQSADKLSGREKHAAGRLTLGINSLVKELGRTLYAFKTYEKSPVSRLVISGGTSKISNIDTYLANRLEMDVVRMDLASTSLKMSAAIHAHSAVIPQAVAIGLRSVGSSRKLSTINLRRGEFAYVQNYESLIKAAGLAAKAVAFAVVLLMFSYGIKAFFYTRQTREVEQLFVKEIAAQFPDLKRKIKTENVLFTKIRSDFRSLARRETQARRVAVDTFIRENSSTPALMALKILSDYLPKTVKVDITTFDFVSNPDGGGKIKLKGETDGYASVASVVSALKSVTAFRDIEEKQSGPKPGTDGKVIEFLITFSYTGEIVVAGSSGKQEKPL